MNLSNQDYELADQRAVDEREAGTETIRKAVAVIGSCICVDCDEPISAARLIAAPFTKRCIHCQTAKENHA